MARAAALPAAAAKPMSEVDEKKAAEEHESHKDELRSYTQHVTTYIIYMYIYMHTYI